MMPSSDVLAIALLGLGNEPPRRAETWADIRQMAQAVLDEEDPRRDVVEGGPA